jgi:hypothetical protein
MAAKTGLAAVWPSSFKSVLISKFLVPLPAAFYPCPACSLLKPVATKTGLTVSVQPAVTDCPLPAACCRKFDY